MMKFIVRRIGEDLRVIIEVNDAGWRVGDHVLDRRECDVLDACCLLACHACDAPHLLNRAMTKFLDPTDHSALGNFWFDDLEDLATEVRRVWEWQ